MIRDLRGCPIIYIIYIHSWGNIHDDTQIHLVSHLTYATRLQLTTSVIYQCDGCRSRFLGFAVSLELWFVRLDSQHPFWNGPGADSGNVQHVFLVTPIHVTSPISCWNLLKFLSSPLVWLNFNFMLLPIADCMTLDSYPVSPILAGWIPYKFLLQGIFIAPLFSSSIRGSPKYSVQHTST